jgi:hypothetical protein
VQPWFESFYNSPKLRDLVVKSYSGVASRYAAQVWTAEGGIGPPPLDFVNGIVDDYADHHLASSRAQLQSVVSDLPSDPVEQKAAITQRLNEWLIKRPAKVGSNETVRIGNAIAVERMRSSGVTRKVWRTVGKGTCPYCKNLSGRTIEVEKAFFEAGESFEPDGAKSPLTFRSSIGHPPVHQGCDCLIEAATEIVAGEGPPGLTGDQYDAMRPQSSWDEDYRLAMRSKLRDTDSGTALFDTLDRFQDGGSIARLRTKIDAYLKGGTLDATSKTRAESLLGALRDAPDWAPNVVYRGTNSKTSLAGLLERYQPGKTIDFNITSFSSDRAIARKFQFMNETTKSTRVMIELVGPNKKMLPIQNLARDRRLFKEKEWVTGGRYRVLETKKAPGGGLIVRIQQETPLGS